ncbi:DUF1330 domain-containing protein [Haloglycomyces albus]|uniref:DUF1330 domain-containing protein n=1 Tax=Haloglycomyces albus TaxID=526067 RepID=UPI00046D206A|nr:DUF1330 domain-containing protein [Haloglycomyces albus]
MAVYAIGLFQMTELHSDMVEYLEKIQDTLEPYHGRFIIHGGKVTPKEGEWNRDVVVIEFPDSESATNWYHSDAYQEILPLRTAHLTGEAFLVEGVEPGYHPQSKADLFRGMLDSQ